MDQESHPVVEFSDELWQQQNHHHHPRTTTTNTNTSTEQQQQQPLVQIKQEHPFHFIPSEFYPPLDYREQGPPPEQPQIQHRRSLPATHVMPTNSYSKQRRYTEGEFLPPQPPLQQQGEHHHHHHPMFGTEEDEEQRRKNFLERNRQAALKCRQRKKQWLANLQNQVEYLNTDNKQLEAQVTALREEILNLKTLIIAHKDCPVARRHSSHHTIHNHHSLSQEMQSSSSTHTSGTIHQHVFTTTNNNNNTFPHPSSSSSSSFSSHFLPTTTTTPTASFYYH
ncbi:hypothetical protein BDA99DRAFT_436511 [Phascolomyces articulosus]|uniref:BZIP domain-containing protein n=1 Tax=Phascolomyces articulosus TaxID=60185 RepID=A0AAD5PF53_9FUNG|nr:hypothetical protein BDA99DRAFT_436511 [Phascolomyces articulosus]